MTEEIRFKFGDPDGAGRSPSLRLAFGLVEEAWGRMALAVAPLQFVLRAAFRLAHPRRHATVSFMAERIESIGHHGGRPNGVTGSDTKG